MFYNTFKHFYVRTLLVFLSLLISLVRRVMMDRQPAHIEMAFESARTHVRGQVLQQLCTGIADVLPGVYLCIRIHSNHFQRIEGLPHALQPVGLLSLKDPSFVIYSFTLFKSVHTIEWRVYTLSQMYCRESGMLSWNICRCTARGQAHNTKKRNSTTPSAVFMRV